MSEVNRTLAIWKKLLFTLVVLFIFLMASEIFVRVKRGQVFEWGDMRQAHQQVKSEWRSVQHDALLAYAPIPGYRGKCCDDKMVTITADGLRSNGRTPPAGGKDFGSR